MSKSKVTPFYFYPMGYGFFIMAATLFYVPQSYVDFGSFEVSLLLLLVSSGFLLFMFGLVFGVFATIKARQAHAKKLKEQRETAAAVKSAE